MKIPVVGLDPSLTGWGIAQGELDLTTGYLDVQNLQVVEPKKQKNKQVRVNSSDLERAEELATHTFQAVKGAKAIFVEVPVGSQSARAMASYGICVGILASIRACGTELIEVTATEVKVAFTGNKNATKDEMIAEAIRLYPKANFPRRGGVLTAKSEHVADAIASIHAGVNTPLFRNLMRLYT